MPCRAPQRLNRRFACPLWLSGRRAAGAGERVELRLQQARIVQVLWPFIASFVQRLSRSWPDKEQGLTQCAPTASPTPGSCCPAAAPTAATDLCLASSPAQSLHLEVRHTCTCQLRNTCTGWYSARRLLQGLGQAAAGRGCRRGEHAGQPDQAGEPAPRAVLDRRLLRRLGCRCAPAAAFWGKLPVVVQAEQSWEGALLEHLLLRKCAAARPERSLCCLVSWQESCQALSLDAQSGVQACGGRALELRPAMPPSPQPAMT